MAVASKTWTVGEVVTAANMNTYVRDNFSDLQTNKAVVYIGTYTGNGSTGQAISGVGFTPKYLSISNSPTDGSGGTTLTTNTLYVDDAATGLALKLTAAVYEGKADNIKSIDADGFTVSDAGTDEHPNKNGETYYYLAIGQE